MTESVHLSVVAAAYNEAENIAKLISEITVAVKPLNKTWEIVIANDGSDDDTPEMLRQSMEICPQLRVIDMKNRTGQTAALDAALRNARGTYVATLDADLQNDPAEIPRLLKLLEEDECDFVNGWRKERNDPWLRLVSTRIANGVRNWLTHEKIHDSACGLKVFKRECLANVRLFTGLHRFLPTLVKMEGYRVKELPVKHRPRTAGIAKYGVWNRIFKALRDTFAIRWMQSRIFHYECKEWKR
ncbi:MAG: glycosyltransferase family 2 protein [Sedimentisphaerales bacterium]|nr:glycosyltransferase family 2 protein [Sedimentisphaerales bacterium]